MASLVRLSWTLLVPCSDMSMEAPSTSTQALNKATFECKVCESTFTIADELRHHLMAHISKVATDSDRRARRWSPRRPSSEPADSEPVPNGQLASFKCTVEGCQYTTGNRERFAEHLGSHRQTNDSGCISGEAFNGTAALLQHNVTSHQQYAFQCGMCNYNAALRMNVILHCRWHHESVGRPVFACKNAGMRTPELTPRPTERADLYLAPYRCSVDYCGFKAISSHQFKLHLTDVHSHLEEFECFLCPESASSPQALVEHTVEHKLGAMMCGLCQHCQLSSLRAMLKHHCDYHPDGSLEIIFRYGRPVTKFEQFIAEFGQIDRYRPQPPCVQLSGVHRLTHIPLITRKRSLSPPDTCSKKKQARDSSSLHMKAPIQRPSWSATPRKQCRRSTGQSHEPALYVVGLEHMADKRVPLSVFTLCFNIEVHVVVKGSERRLSSEYLGNL